MTRLADFFPSGGSVNDFNITAGATLVAKDTILMGPDGLGYKAVCTDYVAVPNTGTLGSAAQGQVVAPTTLIAAAAATASLTMRLPPAIIAADGSNLLFGPSTGSGNSPADAKVYKYSPAGALLGTLALSSGLTGILCQAFMFRLSNNNIAAVFSLNNAGAGNLYFAIFDETLALVLTATAIENTFNNVNPFGACKLSGGGFAVSYQLNGTPASQRLAIYSNAGGVTFAPATVNTWAGANGNVSTTLCELSSGDIAIGCNSNSGTNPGMYHAIRSNVGVQVLAFTLLEAVAINGGNTAPEMSALTGFYAISIGNGTNQKAYVRNNAGALQGAAFSGATNVVVPLTSRLINDGTNFYLIWSSNTGSITYLTRLPTTGTGYLSYVVTTAIPYSAAAGGVDAIIERGLVVAVTSSDANQAPQLGVVTAANGYIRKTATTFGTAPGTAGARTVSITPVGDYAFLANYEYATTAGRFFTLCKYADSSIAGSCTSAATVGLTARVAQNAGSYPSNTMTGTTPKLFDHLTANQYGNKGALLTNGIVLKGM